MSKTSLDRRRRKLGIPIRSLVRMSGMSVATVNRILADPSPAQFKHVAAVARVLGIDFIDGRRLSAKKMLAERVMKKASYVAKIVQGTQGLEASGVDEAGYKRLIEVATTALLAGKRKKLWDDD